ncbi:MAG: ammonia monooxygenase [SAR86 cluster bacterium]|uniref:Ammonia monooxygenase n=1 Tax=SAR86 cluster bacterium TaxID=2030880 RepID=A0A2A4X9Q4_9GAMM|nr:AbrB family transcriptional regulator [Sneathiella sp.]PCI78795.1 MAG: ammonia monooxygenase [SAR86 cluster bacterium]
MHNTSKSLAIVGIGGAVFFLLDLPLAWMMGSMCITTVFALRGVELNVHPPLKNIMVAVLGVMLGSNFSPDTLGNMMQWSNGLLLSFVNIFISMSLVYFYYRKVGKLDRTTAYFSAAPGGFNIMYEVGEAKGGDGRKIALIHATRILLLVMTVPIAFRYGVEIQETKASLPLFGRWEELTQYGWLFLAAVAGYWGGKVLKIPAYHLMGPLFAAAAFELSGFIDVKPPLLVIYAAQLVIGTSLGLRFLGISVREVRQVILLSCGSTALMIAIASLLAVLGSTFVGVSIPGLILALSPGGLAEMSLVALALGIDVAFVSIIHAIRITFIIGVIPLAYPVVSHFWTRRKKA